MALCFGSGTEREETMSTEVKVPTLGESVTEATIGEWLKKPGDAVALDDDQSHGGDYPRGAKRPQRPHQRPASACSCALLPGLKRSSAKPSASRRWGSAGVLGASK